MDPLDPRLLLLAPVVLLSFTTEAMTGFGSIVIAVTIGANFLPIKALLPVLVPLNIGLSGYIVTRHARHIDRRLLLGQILPFTGLGVVAGLAMFQLVEGDLLKRAFGILVVVFAVRELYRLLRAGHPDEIATHTRVEPWAYPWLVAAGITHGIYASGGPLLVYALGRLKISKAVFRATLSTVWLVLNLAMTVGYLGLGRIGSDQLTQIAALSPLVVVGIVAGEFLHHRIDERRFKLGVFGLLIVAGGALINA